MTGLLRSLLKEFKAVSCAAVTALAAAGCTSQSAQVPSVQEGQFTFWLLESTCREDAEAQRLRSRWEEVCRKRIELSAGRKLKQNARLAAFEALREAESRLVKQAQDYLAACAKIKRIVFSVGLPHRASQPRPESFNVSVGESKPVLLEVRNLTDRALTIRITGSSSGGFYVWPWEGSVRPGGRAFSLLRIQPLEPGPASGFVAVEATSPSGRQARIEVPLTGRFSGASPREKKIPAGWVKLTINTKHEEKTCPAVLTLVAQRTEGVKLLSEVPFRREAEKLFVYSQGMVTLAVQPGKILVRARRGPALTAPEISLDVNGDKAVSLELKAACGSWIRDWTAGVIYPPLPEGKALRELLYRLAAEGIVVGHLAVKGASGSFGLYPVTLAETYRAAPCLAAKVHVYTHPVWGGVLGLTMLVEGTEATWNAATAQGDWPDMLSACDWIESVGGRAIAMPSGIGEGANLELPLAAILGKLEGLVLNDETLSLWYDLLSCGFKLAPAGMAGTGLSRTYVRVPGGFTYERYLRHLRQGEVFVTTGPVLQLLVDGRPPGSELRVEPGETVSVEGGAWKDGKLYSAELVINGKVVKTGSRIDHRLRVERSSWIALRSSGAHTGAVTVKVGDLPPIDQQAAERLRERLKRLEAYVRTTAVFVTEETKRSMLAAVQRGRDILEERIEAPLMRDPWARQRQLMVEAQLRRRNIRDPNVLRVMATVPRHLFVPEAYRRESYFDKPLPIGYGQTISQPYIVAFMTEALALKGDEKVLEIGTGSGYQAAVLAGLAREVYTIEIIRPLKERAERILKQLGYRNVHVRLGDGYRGWPEEAPFDAIIVTAAPDHVPPALIEQLAPGGRMVIPVGVYYQDLLLITKDKNGKTTSKSLLPVLFVPMTGEAQQKARNR